ncbi:MAG: hypothetical protein G01um101470_381 [Parcubacteria group bacterium Gr01-1014_70]|nr:MAG: hypothetical protein G01um101470_381 [Parcubacteria group bacterium Gr01-1014_70]
MTQDIVEEYRTALAVLEAAKKDQDELLDGYRQALDTARLKKVLNKT